MLHGDDVCDDVHDDGREWFISNHTFD